MKIAVAGLWHLGTVTAACLAAAGHEVVGFDDNAEVIEGLRLNRLPVAEPGLGNLMEAEVGQGRLRFTSDPGEVSSSEILWICYDTPVDENDVADVEYVYQRVVSLLPHLSDGGLVLISSQIPVGTTARLEAHYSILGLPGRLTFAYSPENLRLGKAIEVFSRPDRVVVGVRVPQDRERLGALFAAFTNRIEWMSVESAEMTKHALNAFLGTSVSFINEIATICERVGVDAQEVERGLKSDGRIGKGAYLHPGSAFTGGTLARDVAFLLEISRQHQVPAHLLAGAQHSNQSHKAWIQRRLLEVVGDLAGKTVAVLGLTYKPGTDTLRRSGSVDTCRWLSQRGAAVQAYDPAVASLPEELTPAICLVASAQGALHRAHVLVVATAWPQFLSLPADTIVENMQQPIVFDPARHLESTLGSDSRIQYFAIGRSHETGR